MLRVNECSNYGVSYGEKEFASRRKKIDRATFRLPGEIYAVSVNFNVGVKEGVKVNPGVSVTMLPV